MTWTGVKRWVATRPAAVIVVGASPCLLPAGISALWFAVAGEALTWLLLPVGAAMLGLGSLSFAVGCMRERAGLSATSAIEPAMETLFKAAICLWTAASLVVWLVLYATDRVPLVSFAALVVGGLVIGTLSAVVLFPAMAVGLGLANWLARRQIASGNWEVTIPVERPEER